MSDLSDFLSAPQHSRTIKLLAVIDWSGGGPLAVRAIEQAAVNAGLRAAKSWNISDILRRSDGGVALLSTGWSLTSKGRAVLKNSGWKSSTRETQNIIDDLNRAAARITSAERRAFVDEAIGCYGQGYNRAAAVLSWAGAVSVLQAHVLTHNLAAFNVEAKKRGLIKKDVASESDLGELREFDFLQVIKALGMIDRNVKQELEERLKLRNSSGHPNSLRVRSRMVAAHLESLIVNVFDRF